MRLRRGGSFSSCVADADAALGTGGQFSLITQDLEP